MGLWNNKEDELEERIRLMDKTIAALNQQVDQKNEELTKLQEELESQKKQLAAKTHELDAQGNLKLELQVAKGNIRDLEEENKKLTSAHNSLLEQYNKLKNEKTPERTPSVPHQTVPHTGGDGNLAQISAKIDKLSALISENARKDEIIRELHAEVQNHTKDLYGQLSKPYLNAIIRVYTNFNGIVEKAKRDQMEGLPEAEALVKRMEPTLVMIQDLLEDEFDVTMYAPKPGDKYDPKLHQAIQTIPTDEEDKAGIVAACRQCGFRRSDTGKVIRQASVIAYRLEK